MNRKDLDALNELYLSVYDGEQLNEAPGGKARFWDSKLGRFVANTGRVAGDVRDTLYGDPSGSASRLARQRLGQRVTGQRVTEYPDQRAARISRAQDAAIAAADKAEKEKATEKPTKPSVPEIQPAGSPPTRTPAGSSSTPPPRPAARPSGPVLSKKDGVEGTGVGADFKEKAFSSAEKSRYASVAAQNAARTSASSGTPKPSSPTPAASAPKPAIGMLGKTSFERRLPTSVELRAAQKERAGGASPEKALQAAKLAGQTQKSNDILASGKVAALGNKSTVQGTQQQVKADNIVKSGAVAALKSTAPTPSPAPARNGFGASAAGANAAASVSSATAPALPGTNSINNKKLITPVNQANSYQWPSAKTIREIAGAYSSIYEAKKKVDQDEDGDNDFADVRVARMIASGVPKAKAIAMVKNKSYNEELELWVNELIEEGYDLSDYTWDEMAEIYLDEATRMRKELGQEGEIATRKELARRSNAYQRSGSVDKTIAAAERGAKSPYVKPVRGESDADRATRERKKSKTLSDLAASRRGSVRDKPRAGLRGYGADVTGSDRELQNSRRSAMAAGTLTPREQKMLNREAYETYEFVASYLLENNFATTVEDANVIINNMSENWFTQIIEDAPMRPEPLWGNKPQVKKEPPMRKEPLWDGPSKTTTTKPPVKKEPPMRTEPLF